MALLAEEGLQEWPELGSQAPDFELPSQFGEPIKLSSLAGTPVVLVFYPFAFSRVCTGELQELERLRPEFESAGIRLMAISVDSKYALRAYATEQALGFELLADFWPHGDVSRRYGCFDVDRGTAARLTIAIDANGTVHSLFSSDFGEPRPLRSYQRIIDELASRN